MTIEGTRTRPFTLPDGTTPLATGKRVIIKGMEPVRIRVGPIVVDNLSYDNLAVLVNSA